MSARRIALALAVGTLVACGGDGADPEPTRFEEALGTLPGREPVGSGYGWVDIERLRDSPETMAGQLEWAAEALGPGAGDLARPSTELKRAGIDPLEADAALAVTSSYPFTIRLDGVDPSGVERTLRAAGAREADEAGWRTFDLGEESSIPLDTPAEPLGSFAARSATREGQVVLTREADARSDLIGDTERAIDADLVAAGAECLGDPVAARFVLNNHTHVPGLGPDLFAFGVLPPDGGAAREVFCGIDDDPARVEAATEELRRTFEAGSTDAVTGEPLSASFAESSIEDFEGHGHGGFRAELVVAPRTDPGEVFGSFDRGSLVTWIGLPPPPLPDDLREAP